MYKIWGGRAELSSQGLCFNNRNCSEEEKGGPEKGNWWCGQQQPHHYLAKRGTCFVWGRSEFRGRWHETAEQCRADRSWCLHLKSAVCAIHNLCIPVLNLSAFTRLQGLLKPIKAFEYFSVGDRALIATGIWLMTLWWASSGWVK